MKWQDYIQIVPGVRSGKACLVGTRITPTDVLEYLAGGMSEDEILTDFPSLTRGLIRAVPAFAAERERRYVRAAIFRRRDNNNLKDLFFVLPYHETH